MDNHEKTHDAQDEDMRPPKQYRRQRRTYHADETRLDRLHAKLEKEHHGNRDPKGKIEHAHRDEPVMHERPGKRRACNHPSTPTKAQDEARKR